MARALFRMEKNWAFVTISFCPKLLLLLKCTIYYIANVDILSCLYEHYSVNLTFCFSRQHRGVLQTGRWWGLRGISQKEELFQRRMLRRGRSILLGPCCLDSSYLLSLDHVRLILLVFISFKFLLHQIDNCCGYLPMKYELSVQVLVLGVWGGQEQTGFKIVYYRKIF